MYVESLKTQQKVSFYIAKPEDDSKDWPEFERESVCSTLYFVYQKSKKAKTETRKLL